MAVIAQRLHTGLQRLWYQPQPWLWLLAPLAWCYQLIMLLREWLYRSGVLPVQRVGVPVIVVGNITVGGTGKTPLVLWLADYLRRQGYRPGIVSRGYGGTATDTPQQVRADSDPAQVGDEPVILARRSGCPVAVCRQRYFAARGLVEHNGCDIIISDDGLQHLALGRDVEIVVIDGQRRLGNGFCLPVGPLREGRGRLRRVSAIVTSGKAGRGEHSMGYQPQPLQSLSDDRRQPLAEWHGQTVHAIAGVGNPVRFFSLLRREGLRLITHEFPDHHFYSRAELQFDDEYPLVMTEKDAIKCSGLAVRNAWYLPITAELPKTFEYRLNNLLQALAD